MGSAGLMRSRLSRLPGLLARMTSAEGKSTMAASALVSPRAVRTAVVAGALGGVIFSGALVWAASGAAFSASTRNPNNNWAAATVAISDDDSSSVMFDLTGLVPGDSGQKCITVTYNGNINTAVRMYASSPSGTLAPYINVTVEQGTGGSFADCTGFASEVNVSQTLSAFAGSYPNHASGFGNWNPNASGQTRTYRFTWSLAADNSAANKTTGVTFTWEARTA
jgi:hypothetical protein